jgi:hypothetical protein
VSDVERIIAWIEAPIVMPHYCLTHAQWENGLGQSAHDRPLTRLAVLNRLRDLDDRLGDEETRQSLGYHRVKELEAERAALGVLSRAIL